MQPRRIDGIYREVNRRPVGRQLLVPERPSAAPLVVPTRNGAVVAPAATPVLAPIPVTPSPLSVAASASPVLTPSVSAISVAAEEAVASPSDTHESKPPRKNKPQKQKSTRRRIPAIFIILAVLVLAGTGALAYQVWRTNAAARTVFGESTQQAGHATATTTDDAVPNEEAVPADAKRAYTVAADMPRTISIDRVGINARILRMSVTAAGAIQAPAGIWDTGWYEGSAKPGQPGNVFIDGHVSGPTMDAVFVKLKTLHSGDYITIERGDGTKITYTVSTVSTNKVEDINMKQVLSGPANVKESLTLMTCGGNYLGNYTYDSRVIVVATRV